MKQKKGKTRFMILCVILECLVLAILIFACVFKEMQRGASRQPLPNQTTDAYSESVQATTQQSTQELPANYTTAETTEATVETTEATVEATEATVEATTATIPETTAATEPTPTETTGPKQTDPPSQPGELTAYLQRNGNSYEDLEQAGCTQLVVVSAKGASAQIQYYEYADGVWKERTELKCNGYVGRNGVSDSKQEGDGTSPIGLYPITEGFYIHQQPQTGLHTFRITPDTYWIDDPDSKFYNQRVEGTGEKDWRSAEHMIDYTQYRYGFVVGYNMPVQPGAGSAIFFHIGASGTSGCISTNEKMVLAYLKALDQTACPHILIIS